MSVTDQSWLFCKPWPISGIKPFAGSEVQQWVKLRQQVAGVRASPQPKPDTHNVRAGGAEGVGPTGVQVSLVHWHQDTDEVEALCLWEKRTCHLKEHLRFQITSQPA